ncbi:hypothetical protein PUNSTDRAFT_134105 [Punctularia strigosozonata HHB-11173 SS5]|uniref:uncharacterized protein n=1 Tax=Punctularia strigosozonata (strain HHB-11173) TaxID=741275 RepID=UPI00044182A9|nr:uncharacterized protein PUNSTDRAFT_134105 [Punctularia strigosozonata HHB-11173 SS5]EIN08931.1 hypothetical protein PUNSTDRAFT_134105 [Punctularia strigosozonata HHB-11173 SS5]
MQPSRKDVSKPDDDDDEDDTDYVPPAARADSPDDSSDSEDGKPGPSVKRRKTSPDSAAEQVDAKSQKNARDALWAEFQSTVANPRPKEGPPARRRIKVEKIYRFAGEDVCEVVEVDEDSEDAKRWPLWRPSVDNSGATTSEPASKAAIPNPAHSEVNATSASPASTPTVHSGSVASATASTPAPNPQPKPPAKRLGPRKSKLSLSSLPDPSSSTSKPKKLSTLDKSAMDWQAHLASAGADKDALEANRRGGGYLDKVEFLERVSERREDALEKSKPSKRRR